MKYCIVCDNVSVTFLKFGLIQRDNAKCPKCGSLERDRLTLYFLKNKTNLFDGNKKRFLHVAPEKSLISIFSKVCGDGYLSVDLYSNTVMEKIDITNINKEDNSFDIIYCSHVLEHIIDDKKAMKELYRVLSKNGWAILNVPITTDITFEDSSIISPKEREIIFGQHDHVRRYGLDYKQRLSDAGFFVSVFRPNDLLTNEQMELFGLCDNNSGEIFYCTKT